MSELSPCGECRRHVAVTDSACPFCGTAREVGAPSVKRLGRMSRAAVFAGAALATACGGKKPKTEPVENQQTQTADAGVEETRQPDDTQRSNPDVPMPYGAPPARRRVV
jgi:hypothetical protein